MDEPAVHYEIRDSIGKYICRRATMAECRRLLNEHVTVPPSEYWDDGPYSVWKVTTEHKFTFKPRHQPPSEGDPRG